MPKNTTERIIDRPLLGRQTARVWSGSSSSANTGTGTGTGGDAPSDALLAVPFLTLTADTTLTNERYLDVTNGLTKFDEGAGARLLLALEVPGTLTVSSTNTSTGNHTHAITSSSNPGAAASILASSVAGDLTLPTLTATTHVRTPLINTASGNLQLSPFADVYVSKQLGIGVSTVEALLHIETTDTATTNFLQIEGNRNAADTEIGILFKDRTAVSGGQQVARIYVDRQGSTGNFDLVFHGGNQTNAGLSSEIMRMKGVDGKVGILQDAPAYTLDVTGNGRFTTSLTTPLLTTETNVDMVINPSGTGAVQFPNDQTLRTTTFDSSFPITGWQINEVAGVSGYSALTIGKIQADELAVRVFVADEVRVDRGDEYWTKSYGIVATTFTTPGSIGGTVSVKFEDSPALVGAIFTNNDWVLIRKLDIDTGITLSNIWGQVATYVNNSDGTQNWTFTLRSGPTSESVTKGSLAIDFGASGAALIHLSVIDAAGAPYIKMRKWGGANPYTPSNFTTYLQIGHLGSTGNTYVTPAGYGLYARSTNDESRFLLADDNGLQIRGAAFKIYNSTLQTVDISATDGSVKLGTDISSGATTSFDFDGATGDLSITGDLHTADVYLTQAEGILLNTGTTDDYVSGYNTKSIQWFSDIDNPTGNALVTLAGAKATNDVYANLSAYSAAGIAKVRLIADSDVASTTDSQMYLRSQTGGNSIIYMFSDTISLQGVSGVTSSALSVSGNITVTGTVDGVDIAAFKSAYDSHNHNSLYLPLAGGTLTGTLTSRTVAPSANNTYDLGSSTNYYNRAYIRNLYTDTIVGTPSYAHSHAAADITSGVLDFARIPTTWTGALTLDADSAGTHNYLRLKTDVSLNKQWDFIAYAHDHATADVRNDLRLNFVDNATTYNVFAVENSTRVVDFAQTPTVGGTAVSLAGHTHDDRYFTEGESDARFAPLAHNQAYTTLTYSGLTAGHVLRASGATAAAFTQLAHSDLSGLTAGDPHTQYLKHAGILAADATNAINARLIIGSPTIIDPYQQIYMAGAYPGTRLECQREWGDAAFDLFELYAKKTSAAGSALWGKIGVLGDFGADGVASTPAVTYMYFGAAPDTTYNNNAFKLFANNTAQFSSHVVVFGDIDLRGELLAANGTVGAPSIAASSDTNTGLYWSAADTLAVATGGTLRLSVSMAAVTSALPVLAPAGTAGAPALAFSGDTNTGIYSVGADSFGVSVGGTLRATITTSSLDTTVRINAAPDADNNHFIGRLAIGHPLASDTVALAHYDNLTSTNYALHQYATGETRINAANGQTLSLSVAGTPQWIINSDRMLPRGDSLVDLGDYNRKLKRLWLTELVTSTLVAEKTIATIGGNLLVTPTTKLIAAIDSATGAPGGSTLYANTVAYWPLDETSGIRIDARGANDLSSGSVGYAAGKQGNAAAYTGSLSNAVSDNTALSTGNVTWYFAGWIYPTDNNALQCIAAKGSPTGDRSWALRIAWHYDNAVYLDVWSAGQAQTAYIGATSFGGLSINTWYFVECWHDAANDLIGVAVNRSQNTTGFSFGTADDTGPFTVGQFDFDQGYIGRIDEVIFIKGYLPNSTERNWLYNAGNGRTYTDLYSYGAADINVDVENNHLRSGEYILLKTAPGGVQQSERMKITSGATAIAGGYRYTATRDQDASGANAWQIGDAVASEQKNPGEGYMWLTASATDYGHSGPSLIGYVRTGTGPQDIKPAFALGNLRNLVDYTTDEYGDGAGNDLTLTPTTGFKGYLIDRTNGMRLFNTDLKLYASGIETLRLTQAEGLRLTAGSAMQNQIDVYSGVDKVYAQWTQLEPTFNNTDTWFVAYGKPGLGMGTLTLKAQSADGLDSAHIAIGSTYINLAGKPVTIFNGATVNSGLTVNGNLGVNGSSFGSGANVVFMANATTVPTTNPSGGGILYVQGGALKYRGSSGTVTTIANA